jgi:glutamyl-tRNA synthetase
MFNKEMDQANMNLESRRQIADLLFPSDTKPISYYEEKYPSRELPDLAEVTRFSPSPTGFIHIGSLYCALISNRIADQSDGIFMLRIEDTDKKREIPNGVSEIVQTMKRFGIDYDEGQLSDNESKGEYGPYKQSDRAEIYIAYTKHLVELGLAYPCFSTQEELEEMRKEQERQGVLPGYYGKWATSRNLTVEKIKEKLSQGKVPVIRLKSPQESGSVRYRDIIKGELTFPSNNQDVIIAKSDGLPTYHFAHAIDDHLMHTTLVIRGEEWLPSVPLHLQLFSAFSWEPPKYAHIPLILKSEGKSKRKLSKRKDPEAAATYYLETGIPTEAVISYLTNLANSGFEDWFRSHPDESPWNYKISLEKMSKSGALMDLVKLIDISKAVISRMPAEQISEQMLRWAQEYNPNFAQLIFKHKDYFLNILNIEKGGPNTRKDFAQWSEVPDKYGYFFDEIFDKLPINKIQTQNIHDNKEISTILTSFLEVYRHSDSKEVWLNKIKNLCINNGYASSMKEFNESKPGTYKGHLGDVTMALRTALTKRDRTPDLYETISVMGENRVKTRIKNYINSMFSYS